MELTNEFSVKVPIDEAWSVLTDLERIAPCMPGAELQEVEGDEYRGVVKVKVGPITAQYKGVATFQECDDLSHTAVIRAEGRDTRGQGNAAATITAVLTPEDGGTQVSVITDLTVTGKVAQFGRGVMGDVSAKLLDQFVQALEANVLSGVDTPADAVPASTPSLGGNASPRRIDSKPAEPVNLVGAAGSAVLRRAVPLVAVLVLVLWLLWLAA